MPQSDIAASKRTPVITVFIEFPATYEWAGTGYQLATSKVLRGRFAVDGATDNRKAAVFSSVFDLLAVALMAKFKA